MLIYRIQDADGFGPYQSRNRIISIYDSHNEIAWEPNSRVPPPSREGLAHIGPHDRFGFMSVEQLDSWFTVEEQVALFREGFELVVIDVPDHLVTKAQHQCKFLREDLCTP